MTSYNYCTKKGNAVGEKSFKEMLSEVDVVQSEIVPIVIGAENISGPCGDATIEEAEKIWPKLEASLDPQGGFGLTANQIGINKKVAFIRYADKNYRLLNTKIVETGPIVTIYNEGCLSIPGKTVHTQRYQSITIEDDVLGRMDLTMSKNGLLPIIFQHEIDHMNGMTILDRKRQPIKRKSAKIGRNQPCPCGSGKKYKKCCGQNE